MMLITYLIKHLANFLSAVVETKMFRLILTKYNLKGKSMLFWYFLVAFGLRFDLNSLYLFIYALLFISSYLTNSSFILWSLFYFIKNFFLLFYVFRLLLSFFNLFECTTFVFRFMTMRNAKFKLTVFTDDDTFILTEDIVLVKRANSLTFLNLWTVHILFLRSTIALISVLSTKMLLARTTLKTKIVFFITYRAKVTNVGIFHFQDFKNLKKIFIIKF